MSRVPDGDRRDQGGDEHVGHGRAGLRPGHEGQEHEEDPMAISSAPVIPVRGDPGRRISPQRASERPPDSPVCRCLVNWCLHWPPS
jgi:hypothetical protein